MSYDAYLAGLGRDELIAVVQTHRKLFTELSARITKSRERYPEGCTLAALTDECGEVMHAVNKYKSTEEVREEILDLASVAIRLYWGEIDRTRVIDGLNQLQIGKVIGPATRDE